MPASNPAITASLELWHLWVSAPTLFTQRLSLTVDLVSPNTACRGNNPATTRQSTAMVAGRGTPSFRAKLRSREGIGSAAPASEVSIPVNHKVIPFIY